MGGGVLKILLGVWGALSQYLGEHDAVEKYLWKSSSVSKVAGYKPASLQIY